MKKLRLVLIFFIGAFSLSASGQGIKGVEIGDYGLTSPMWGRSSIETTLLGVEGTLEVKKFDRKIYSIIFKATYFSQENVDKLAKSLKEKYNITSLEKGLTNNWLTRDENDRVQVMIESQNQSFGRRWYVLTMHDKVISRKASESKKNKTNNDF